MLPRNNHTPEKNSQDAVLRRINLISYTAAQMQYIIAVTQPEATAAAQPASLQVAETPPTATATGAKVVEQVTTEPAAPTLSAEAFTAERQLEEIRRQIEEA